MAHSFEALSHYPAQRMATKILSGHPIVASHIFQHPEQSDDLVLVYLLIYATDEFLLASCGMGSARGLMEHPDDSVSGIATHRLSPLLEQIMEGQEMVARRL